MIVTTEAIILKSIKYGDSSKILQLYTHDFGKLSVIAKGARQLKSKFGGSLEPMTISNVCFYKKANKDLHTLSSAEIILNADKINQSLEHIVCGMLILESVIQTIVENEIHIPLYNLLKVTLSELNNSPKNPYSIFVYFEINLIHILGFSINFDYTIHQNQKMNNYKFSLENGCIINDKNKNDKNFFNFDAGVLTFFNEIDKINIEEVTEISIPVNYRQQIKDFFVSYFSYHLEKPFGFNTFRLLK